MISVPGSNRRSFGKFVYRHRHEITPLVFILSTGKNCAFVIPSLIETAPLLDIKRHDKKAQFMAVFSITFDVQVF